MLRSNHNFYWRVTEISGTPVEKNNTAGVLIGGALPAETIPGITLEMTAVAGDNEQLRNLGRTMPQ